MIIDPHVHFRDEEQSYKETIAHGLRMAELAGVTAVFDMPNPKRPITTEERVRERLAIAEKANSPVFYGVYAGLTADKDQVARAVDAYQRIVPLIGLKMYAGKSVGDISITREDHQFQTYQRLAEVGYNGVLAVHCEKESLMHNETFDPTNPITHAYARPPEAEIQSVRDQLSMASAARFKGTLHIAHTSVPEVVRIVRGQNDVRATIGVCPHHIIFDFNAMNSPNGLLLKMNPPLRQPGMNTELEKLLLDGMIDWVETDHAPHTYEEKMGDPYMSGVVGITKLQKFRTYLRSRSMSEARLSDVFFNNANRVFGLGLEPLALTPKPHLIDTTQEYGFDPYKGSLLE